MHVGGVSWDERIGRSLQTDEQVMARDEPNRAKPIRDRRFRDRPSVSRAEPSKYPIKTRWQESLSVFPT